MTSQNTQKIEDSHMPPFFLKIPICIDHGKGVYVWDEEGRKFIDFTSGWGVTCIGHGNEAMTQALLEQSRKIIQNPNSGFIYSPARAKLLALMDEILPSNLTRTFFTNSGAEANDAAIKLARKVTGRMDVISTHQSFHGRTISTASATGQVKHREKFNPLMPNYRFVEYDDLNQLKKALDKNVAAVILEPIQGEGGINVPSNGYLQGVKDMCEENSTLLIIDEIQTGFCRTGPMFLSASIGVATDIMTMAKGIAGGFPFGAFSMSEKVYLRVELGDHGGTYCGNPLGCAISYAVISYILENRISENVIKTGQQAMDRMLELKDKYKYVISDIRGKGLLLLVEFKNEDIAARIVNECLNNGLIVNLIQGKGIRVIPALNIKEEEMDEGLSLLEKSVKVVLKS
jgi:acetylornithine/N-succinyldiaminopimelate aminotransferase